MVKHIKKFLRRLIKIHNHGKNNFVPHVPERTLIKLYGDNNKVIIDSSITCFTCLIKIGDSHNRTNNCTVQIGKGSTSNDMEIILLEHNSEVIIGEDCMFSWRIRIDNTDHHALLDKNSGKVINIGKKVNIGNHVWIGMDTFILKNTSIASNCVVGAKSLITKNFTEENVVIAGNPAKIVKTGITWDRRKPNDFCK